MGFPPSIGKVYYSKSFFDFNSECYCQRVQGTPLGSFISGYYQEKKIFERIPFCHTGLLFCKTRTGDDVPLDGLLGLSKGLSLGSIQKYLLDRCPSVCRIRMMEQFYQKALYRSDIYRNIKGLPWYLPSCLGGLGLQPVYRDWVVPISSFDVGERHACHAFIHKSKTGQSVVEMGPSEYDMRLARIVANRLSHGESLPTRPTLGVNVSPVTDPDSLCIFGHINTKMHDDCAMTYWHFWANVSKHTAEKALVSGKRIDERLIVMQYCRQLKRYFYDAKAFVGSSLKGWRCIDSLSRVNQAGSVEIFDQCRVDELIRTGYGDECYSIIPIS
jgi:hypothetical protein